jgi:hypothetical protein
MMSRVRWDVGVDWLVTGPPAVYPAPVEVLG